MLGGAESPVTARMSLTTQKKAALQSPVVNTLVLKKRIKVLKKCGRDSEIGNGRKAVGQSIWEVYACTQAER
jgi:hypothetical protein